MNSHLLFARGRTLSRGFCKNQDKSRQIFEQKMANILAEKKNMNTLNFFHMILYRRKLSRATVFILSLIRTCTLNLSTDMGFGIASRRGTTISRLNKEKPQCSETIFALAAAPERKNGRLVDQILRLS